jgi:hypothetical protein
MSRRPSKVTRGRIRNGQLANAQGGTAGWIESRRQRDAEEIIKASRKFAIHFMLSQTRTKDEMEDLIHPVKALAVSKQFHHQRGRCQYGHAGHKFGPGDEMIEARKEKAKRGVQDFATKVDRIAILESK